MFILSNDKDLKNSLSRSLLLRVKEPYKRTLKIFGVKIWPSALRIEGHKPKSQDQDTNNPHAGPTIPLPMCVKALFTRKEI